MKPLFSVIQSRSFHCFVVCWLVLFQRMAGTGYSKTYASPPDNALILAMSRYSYYTTEDKGHVLLSLPEAFQGRLVSADLLFEGKTIVENFSVRAGERTFIPFPLDSLSIGINEVACLLTLSRGKVDTIRVDVVKRLPKSNEVKIDCATGGLIVDGLPFFPFGFYCYSPVQPTLAEEEVVKGFNMMSPYQRIDRKNRKERKRYMDRCAELGMKVHYNLLNVAGGGGVGSDHFNQKTDEEKRHLLEQEVKAFRNHPALLAWYISDEPVGQNVPVENLIYTYQVIKTLDPYHPITIVFMTPKRAKDYENVFDVVMADPYPIPNHSVTEVGSVTRDLISDFNISKPVWIIPQAFGGNEWWRREPTAQEIRAMTYLAVIHGATGIQYFIRHGLSGFPKSTVTWGECGAMAREIAELTPFLLSSESSPTVSSSMQAVHVGGWKDGDKMVILAVNTENRPLSVSFRLRGIPLTGNGDVLFENRRIRVRNGFFQDGIDALGTRVYMIPFQSTPEEVWDIDPKNLMVNHSFEENPSVGTPSGCYVRVNGERGSTYFVDSRVAHHGRHSLRLITPREGEGVELAFFPFQFKQGNSYCFSIWAKTKDERRQSTGLDYGGFFKKLFPWIRTGDEPLKFRMQLGRLASEEFALTSEWKRYSITAAKPDTGMTSGRVSPQLMLVSQGKAWFDCMEVVIDPVIQSEVSESGQAVKVTISTKHEKAQVRYTLDGSRPSNDFPVYQEPIFIDKTGVIKAGVFKEDELLGVTEKSLRMHSAFGKKITYRKPYSTKYNGGGDLALADGLTGSTSYLDECWQGFLKEDMDVTIDLGEIQPVQEITARFLQNRTVWVFLPTHIEYSVSTNGRRFQSVARISNTRRTNRNGIFVQKVLKTLQGIRARFIRVKAKNIGICPPWHRGAGGKAWIFADEIVVN